MHKPKGKTKVGKKRHSGKAHIVPAHAMGKTLHHKVSRKRVRKGK